MFSHVSGTNAKTASPEIEYTCDNDDDHDDDGDDEGHDEGAADGENDDCY